MNGIVDGIVDVQGSMRLLCSRNHGWRGGKKEGRKEGEKDGVDYVCTLTEERD